MSKIAVFALCVALLIGGAGCAGKQTPEFNAKYYPECYDPIDKLCKDQSNKAEVKGAVTGGIIGAIGGAVIGGLATGKVEGALVGAGAGAVAGAMTGFFAARLNKIKDQEQRLAEYQNVLGEQSQEWDLERATVERSYKCYGDQIKLLEKAMKAKQMTREEFLARMQEIAAGIRYINTYWADSQTRMDETLADGEKWLAAEDAEAAKAQQKKNVAAVQTQRKNLAKARSNNKNSNERVNNLKNQTIADAQRVLNQFDNTGVNMEFTSLEWLVASL